jgi:hypothetical protein
MLGGERSPFAFCELCNLLLHATILPRHRPGLRLYEGDRRYTYLLGGQPEHQAPLLLTDGRYLHLVMTLFIEKTRDGARLKVDDSAYQYQIDQAGERWIFRYDYERRPPTPHPATHFHIRGNLSESCLPPGVSLEKIHFPAIRISLEAVIRLLIEQFKVPMNERNRDWRAMLAESEEAFMRIAHRPLSGPSY